MHVGAVEFVNVHNLGLLWTEFHDHHDAIDNCCQRSYKWPEKEKNGKARLLCTWL